MKQLVIATSLVLTLLTAGCASICGDNSKIVHVNSRPGNASVYMNHMPVGETPVTVTVPSTWSPTLLTFKKKGYQTETTQINNAFQPVGLVNILFWPGFIVDAVSGNMMKVAPESRNINVDLTKSA
ncbi:MAG: PEGA domain-containing protein [Gammaproteobacteria bacterium]|nr:PEGA domain-containing protein [Gammaproteobacteria bacterium]